MRHIGLIILGTFLRGPNWNFFGIYEFWDVHKLEVLNSVNLSEMVWVDTLKQPLPKEIGEDVLAYVGCIAGAISFEEYRQGLLDARFSDITIIDSGADLNAYAKVENQAACCSPSMSKQTADYVLPVVSACCGTPATDDPEHKFHGDLRDLLSRYNVNDYAASVKVFAIKAS